MRALPMIGLVLGLLIFVLLILWQGIGEIFDLLATSGWELLTLPIVWAPCLLAAAYSWRLLFPKQHTPEFGAILKALWIGRAINTLLPVASIGGEIAKARLITLWGTSGVDSSASVLVDKTVQAMAVAVWAFTGTLLLIYLALDYGTAQVNGQQFWFWLGLAAAAGAFIDYIVDLIHQAKKSENPEAITREEQAKEPKQPEDGLDWLIYIFHKLSRADFCIIVLGLSLFNVTWILLPFAAVGAQAYWITDLFERARGYHT